MPSVADIDQSLRLLKISTAVADGSFVLTELDGVDELSRPFVFKIKMITDKTPSVVRTLLGTKATIEFGPTPEMRAQRKFHGFFRSIRRTLSFEGFLDIHEWEAELVPALWFQSCRSDIRIFQDMTFPQILTTILNAANVPHKVSATKFASHSFDYCVQYRETNLDFMSRWMEKFGWFYYHDHVNNQLVIADANVQALRGNGRVSIYSHGGEGTLMRFQEEYSVRTGKWTTRDFDYNTFDHEVHEQPTKLTTPGISSSVERYDYPGAYFEKSRTAGQAGLYPVGRDMTTVEIEREEARHHTRYGESDLATLDAGSIIEIDTADLHIDDPKVLVIAIRHRAQDYSHLAGGPNSPFSSREDQPRAFDAPSYVNEFTCIPEKVPFRPPLLTPRPFVHGPQTARVVGGGEIDSDSLGRVKVRFHWDRNPGRVCWIRVSQGWAGKGFGHIQIPRVGEEVIVDFLEGDPDRPIITGRVYNGQNTVPYALPANQTQSGIKTRSSPGGGTDNFNELRFEDKKGSEQIFVHAEKDLDTEVENNETRKVGLGSGTGNRTTDIKNDELTRIKGNKTTEVTKDFKETITGTETREVTGNVTETFRANETRTVLGTFTETVTGAYTITVAPGAYTLSAVGGINFSSPAPILANSAAIINVVAPTVNQAAPSWFKSGSHAGDAYGFKMGIAGLKFDLAGISIGIVPVLKFDVAGIKMDNFGIAIKTGALELKNASLKAKTYAFALKTGFSIKT